MYTALNAVSYNPKAGSKVNSLEQFLFHFLLRAVGGKVEHVEAGVCDREPLTANPSIHSLDDHLWGGGGGGGGMAEGQWVGGGRRTEGGPAHILHTCSLVPKPMLFLAARQKVRAWEWG